MYLKSKKLTLTDKNSYLLPDFCPIRSWYVRSVSTLIYCSAVVLIYLSTVWSYLPHGKIYCMAISTVTISTAWPNLLYGRYFYYLAISTVWSNLLYGRHIYFLAISSAWPNLLSGHIYLLSGHIYCMVKSTVWPYLLFGRMVFWNTRVTAEERSCRDIPPPLSPF